VVYRWVCSGVWEWELFVQGVVAGKYVRRGSEIGMGRE